ncbi:MAG: TldD/PmbA family protein, partial [Planctomycetota bacterium]
MEKILEAAKKKAEAAEVFSLETLTRSVGYEAGVLKRISEKESRGVGLRVLAGGKMGHVATSKLDAPEKAAEKAVALAELGEEASFAFPGPSELPALNLMHPETEALTVDAMVETCGEAVEKLRVYHPELKVSAGYGTGSEKIRIINTSGFEGGIEVLALGFGAGGLLVEGDNIVACGKSHIGLKPPTDPMGLVDVVIEKLDLARKIVPFPSGKFRAILTPVALADILMAFLPAANGKAVAKGMSPLKDKLGVQILDPRITLVDDGLHPEGVCSQPFDDEGLPVRRKTIVEKGVLKTFITDLRSAAQLGVEPTGNGVREKPLEREKTFGAPPAPNVWNVVLEPGTLSYESMVANTELGVEIHAISGILLGNLINGDFSGTLSMAFKVEKGERVGRVKDVMVSGNFYSLFKDRLIDLESKQTWTGNFGGDVGAYLLPHAY